MDLEPVGYDGTGAPLYEHQLPQGVPIINARDCELARFNLADVLEAAKSATP